MDYFTIVYKMSDYCDIEKVREAVDISVVDLKRFRESSVFPAGTAQDNSGCQLFNFGESYT